MAATMTQTPLVPSSSSSKGGFFKRITTKIRSSPSSSASSSNLAVAASPSGPASTSNPSPPAKCKAKSKGLSLLPSLPAPPRPNVQSTAHANGFISAEQRTAALRARGLAPALPMSEQERAMDARFSVVVPEPGSSRNSNEGEAQEQESEARRIMEEWIRRNSGEDGKEDERGPESEDVKVVVSVVEAGEPQNGSSGAAVENAADASAQGVFLDPKDIPLPATPRLPPPVDSEDVVESPPSSSKLQDALPAGEQGTQMETEHAESCADAEGQAQIVEVAPDNVLTVEEGARDTLAASLPLSPLPDFEDPRSPRSLTIPTLSVSPPPPPAPLSKPQASVSDMSSSDSVERGRSLSTTTDTTVPALSPTRSASSCATSDESPNTPVSPRGRKTSGASSDDRGRVGLGLEVKTVLGPDVMDSPVEDAEGGVKFAFADPGVLKGLHAVVEEEGGEDAEAEDTVGGLDERGTLQPDGERRKGVFGRKASSKPPPPSSRLSTARSFGNLRRSVTGSISSKLGLRSRTTSLVVDTSVANSPPDTKSQSPMHAAPLSSPEKSSSPTATSTNLARQALAPTMYSRGSLLAQAKEIEDEESRRLSEAAFLDF